MNKKYAVYYKDREAGCAYIKREGLYYDIDCTCSPGSGSVFVLFAQGEGEKIRLGVPVPYGAEFVLRTKIPAKRFPETISKLYLLEKGAEMRAINSLLKEGEPIAELESILNSKLEFTENDVMLINRHK